VKDIVHGYALGTTKDGHFDQRAAVPYGKIS
jgi:hypothetical protein